MSRGHAVLLRPGHISAAQIAAVIGSLPALPDQGAPRASGTLESHYAPATPVVLVDSECLSETLQKLHAHGRRVALMQHAAVSNFPVAANISLSATPASYAHDLYAALRAMDDVHADVIVVQTPPSDDAWNGVNDRLRRAAHDSSGILLKLLQD